MLNDHLLVSTDEAMKGTLSEGRGGEKQGKDCQEESSGDGNSPGGVPEETNLLQDFLIGKSSSKSLSLKAHPVPPQHGKGRQERIKVGSSLADREA